MPRDPAHVRSRHSGRRPLRVLPPTLLLLAVALGAAGQESSTGRYRVSGDTANWRTLAGGERLILLIGNARVYNEEIDITGDLARFYRERGVAQVVGDVKAVSESLTLWADSLHVYEQRAVGHAFGDVRLETLDGVMGTGRRGHYRREQDWLALAGDARVIDGPTMVQGDSITFDRPSGIMDAYGSVSVVDQLNRTVVVGERGRFDRASGVAVVDSVPELRSRRGQGDMTTVRSRWMSFDRAARVSTAVGDVEFRQGATQAHADTARFVGEDLLVMSGAPSVEQQGRVMTGEEIRFHYVDAKLRRIEVQGGASLVDSSPDTLSREFTSIPLANTLSGDSLTIWIDDGEIVRTFVKGDAHSVYLPEDQEKVVSVNDVEGDSIDIRFRDGLVDRVLVIGAVSGTYRYLERSALQPDTTAVESDSLLASPPPGSPSPSRTESDPTASAPADSALIGPAPADSALASTAAPDSVRQAATSRLFDFEGNAQSVDYEGSETLFRVQDGRIQVAGEAKVSYGTLELYAREVHFDTEARELLAEGDPRLVDKDSELVGERMGYLFEPRTGAVGDGATRFDDGFYYGEHIRRVDEKTLLVEHGTYTTCDLAEPHYHFRARKMKLKIGESVVARQVTFLLSDIPLITLPFYYKSLDSGRHSGILFPNINLGVSSRDGRYVRDLGYYWATSEYTDFQFLFDYNERNDMRFTVKNVYNVRYGMSGNVDAWYYRRFSEREQGDEWKINARHSHPELWEVWRAGAQIELSSRNLTRGDRSGDARNDLIESRLYSTASLSRSFDNGASLNISGTRTQFPNAEDDDDLGTNNRLNELSIPLSVSFKSGPLMGGRHRAGEGAFASLLRDLQYSHRYTSQYDRRINEASAEQVGRVSGSFGLSYAPTARISVFKFTSSANSSQAWQLRDFQREAYAQFVDPADSMVFVDRDPANDEDFTESEFSPSLSFSNRLSTDLYGIFYPRIGPVQGLKHKVSWSVAHNFSPELGDKQEQNQNFSFSLGNELSLKVLEGEDESGEVALDENGEPRTRKLDQLVTWNLSTSYDPDAEPRRQWTDIRSDVRLRPGVTRAVSFSMNQSFDPYSLEVKSTRFNSDLTLRGGIPLGGAIVQRPERKNAVIERLPAAEPDTTLEDPDALDEEYSFGYDDPYGRLDEEWLETGDRNVVPWDLYLRGSLSQTRNLSTDELTTRANMSARANLSLPGQWKLSWSSDFDVETGEFTNQFWTLSRQLHDWTLQFNRGLADGQDFGFSLYLNPIPDLRVDRGDRARSGDLRSRFSRF